MADPDLRDLDVFVAEARTPHLPRAAAGKCAFAPSPYPRAAAACGERAGTPRGGRRSCGGVPWLALAARGGRPMQQKGRLDRDCSRARYSSGGRHVGEFERAGRLTKVDPPAKLISTNMGLAMR